MKKEKDPIEGIKLSAILMVIGMSFILIIGLLTDDIWFLKFGLIWFFIVVAIQTYFIYTSQIQARKALDGWKKTMKLLEEIMKMK